MCGFSRWNCLAFLSKWVPTDVSPNPVLLRWMTGDASSAKYSAAACPAAVLRGSRTYVISDDTSTCSAVSASECTLMVPFSWQSERGQQSLWFCRAERLLQNKHLHESIKRKILMQLTLLFHTFACSWQGVHIVVFEPLWSLWIKQQNNSASSLGVLSFFVLSVQLLISQEQRVCSPPTDKVSTAKQDKGLTQDMTWARLLANCGWRLNLMSVAFFLKF